MPAKPITQNTLFYGDNLPILREYIADESVDLIYLDPPFNSNRSYNVLYKDESGHESVAQAEAFEDTWHWNETAALTYRNLVESGPERVASMIGALHESIGENQMMAYLVMMAARLVELHRVLKPTGSLYLHCDPTASHYLKIVLDTIFGSDKCRSEVIWKRTSAHNSAKRWAPVHDVIFFYTKSNEYTWNKLYESYDQDYIDRFYRYKDAKGSYRLSDLTGTGVRTGDSGKEWRGVNPTLVGRHWAVPNAILQSVVGDEVDISELTTQEKLDLLDKYHLIYFPPKGSVPQFKRYFDPNKGNPIQDVISDIDPISAQAAERLGYPTQKPLALLERIINASSNERDVVLDPFCGCGTTIAAAQKLNRRWIGIDITHLAIALQKNRLKDMFDLKPVKDYRIIGEPTDIGSAKQLANEDRYQFQFWALSLIQARPLGGLEGSKQGKKGSDKGIDGVLTFIDDPRGKPKRALVQVKSGHVKSGDVRDLRGTLEREVSPMGVFITLEAPTREMEKEALAAGFYHSPLTRRDYPKLQIVTVDELLNGKEVKMPITRATFKQAGRVEQGGTQAAMDLD